MRCSSIALLLQLSLSACSSDKPAGQAGGDKPPAPGESKTAAQPGKHDACAFMTLEDVREAYGPAMKKSGGVGNLNVSGPSNDVSTCTYEGGDPLIVATMMATWSNSAEGNPMASRDAYVKAAEDQPPDIRAALKCEKTDFHGLPALWQAGQLKVFKEGVMLSILADPVPGKNAKETMEMLMAKAVGRL
jgi:hypothetical protein